MLRNAYILDMDEDFTMRTVYLTHQQDAVLRQLAHEMGCTFSELVRAAVASKLIEWRDDPEKLSADLRNNDVIPIDQRDERHRIAKAIVGPWNLGQGVRDRKHLQQLRQVRWDMLTPQERETHLAEALSVMKELED